MIDKFIIGFPLFFAFASIKPTYLGQYANMYKKLIVLIYGFYTILSTYLLYQYKQGIKYQYDRKASLSIILLTVIMLAMLFLYDYFSIEQTLKTCKNISTLNYNSYYLNKIILLVSICYIMLYTSKITTSYHKYKSQILDAELSSLNIYFLLFGSIFALVLRLSA